MTDQLKWNEAARGLELHRSAVVARVVVLVFAVLYALVQGMSNGTGEPNGFALLIGFAELAATVAALVGVARFAARVPSDSGGIAMLAVPCLLIVIGIEVYGLWILYKVMEFLDASKRATSMWNSPSMDILDHVERLPTMQIVGGIAGLVAVLVVLGTIAGVGRVRGVPTLARRARGLAIAVVVLAIAYGAIMRWAEHARHASAGEMLMVLGGVALFGLVVLFTYIGTLTAAADVMRLPVDSELPQARIVDGDSA